MSLNPHERAFSFEEVARIADVDLAHFRVMLFRAGEDAPGQKRRDGRILFSSEDVLAAVISVSLVRFGMKIADAFSFGRALAVIDNGKPGTTAAHFYFRSGKYHLNCLDAVPTTAAIVVPIETLWREVQSECADLYARSSA